MEKFEPQNNPHTNKPLEAVYENDAQESEIITAKKVVAPEKMRQIQMDEIIDTFSTLKDMYVWQEDKLGDIEKQMKTAKDIASEFEGSLYAVVSSNPEDNKPNPNYDREYEDSSATARINMLNNWKKNAIRLEMQYEDLADRTANLKKQIEIMEDEEKEKAKMKESGKRPKVVDITQNLN